MAKETLRCSMCDEPLSYKRARAMLQIIRPSMDDAGACIRSVCLLCFTKEQAAETRRHCEAGGQPV